MNNYVADGNLVRIRPITMADTELIVKWRNTPEVQQQFVFQKTFTNEIHQAWMQTKVFTGEVDQFIIETLPDNKPIGSVYLRDIDNRNMSAEFGIFIGETDCFGKGYGSEASQLILDYGFCVRSLHRIFLRVFSDNVRAIASYRKSGFTEEGIARDMIRQNGRYRSMQFMAVIKEA